MDSDLLLPAPLWRRLAAIFYDALLLLAGYFIVGGIYVGIASQLGGFKHPNSGFSDASSTLPVDLLQLTLFPLLLGLTILFFSYFWMRHGRTLGMQTWQLTIAPPTSDPKMLIKPTLRQCLIRLCFATVSMACLGIGFWWAIWDPQKKTWHDHGSKTHIYFNP